jgi:hypothetical protein
MDSLSAEVEVLRSEQRRPISLRSMMDMVHGNYDIKRNKMSFLIDKSEPRCLQVGEYGKARVELRWWSNCSIPVKN